MDASTSDNIRQAVPFFLVSNMEASLRFYVDGLGFSMTDEWIDDGVRRWCWLQRGGAAAMLQAHRRDQVAAAASSGGGGLSVYFICEDALALYREFTARGVTPRRPFVGNAMWVVSVKDPDGYELHFESVTDVAEETEYVEP